MRVKPLNGCIWHKSVQQIIQWWKQILRDIWFLTLLDKIIFLSRCSSENNQHKMFNSMFFTDGKPTLSCVKVNSKCVNFNKETFRFSSIPPAYRLEVQKEDESRAAWLGTRKSETSHSSQWGSCHVRSTKPRCAFQFPLNVCEQFSTFWIQAASDSDLTLMWTKTPFRGNTNSLTSDVGKLKYNWFSDLLTETKRRIKDADSQKRRTSKSC